MPTSPLLQSLVRRASLLASIATLSLSLFGCADDGGDKKADGEEESSDSAASADRGMGDGSDVITIGDSPG